MKSTDASKGVCAIVQAVEPLGMDILLIGSWALELALDEATREVATSDVDLAIRMTSWNELTALDRALPTHRLDRDALRFKGEPPIDIIPFGPIAAEGVLVPHQNDPRRITTKDFDAIMKSARLVTMGDVRIPVPTLPGQAALKFLAYGDSPDRNKDLSHLRRLLALVEAPDDPWEDPYVGPALLDGRLQHEDILPWLLGCRITEMLGDTTRVRAAVEVVQKSPFRGQLSGRPDPDDRLSEADRTLRVLLDALSLRT